MQLPIDIGAVMEAAFDVEAARRATLCVTVYIDDSAPSDVQAHVRQAFASSSPSARVAIAYLDGRMFVPFVNDDMAVIVAGLNDQVGCYAARLRASGIPVMVATTLPTIVEGTASASGYPIPAGDVVAPLRQASRFPLFAEEREQPTTPADSDEPLPFTDDARALLDERMGDWVCAACADKRLAFALAFPFVRRPLSLDEVETAAAQNAAVGFLPIIPGADLPIMTLNQAKMVLAIAAAYGEDLGMERVKELVGVVAGGLACRKVVRSIGLNTPVVGWAVKAAVGYAGTMAMGRAAIRYYEGDLGLETIEQALGGAQAQVLSSVAGAAVSAVRDAAADTWRKANDYAAARAAGAPGAAGATEGEAAR